MASLRFDANLAISTATLQRADGKTLLFSLNGNTWTPDDGVFSKLDRITDANGTTSGWRYTTPDNHVEVYNTAGKLISISDSHGSSRNLSYDSSGRLDRVDADNGEYLKFGYDLDSSHKCKA